MSLTLLSQTLWVVVGATGGMAKAFARYAAEQKAPLLLFGRQGAELAALREDLLLRGSPYVEALEGDLNNHESRVALASLVSHSPLPLGVFLAPALMPDHTAMLEQEALCEAMLTTNFTSSILLMNQLLPLVETRVGSSVVIVSSIAGDRGRASNFLYGATKAGISAYAEGLAARLAKRHIPVLIVKPGPVDTAMAWGVSLPPLPLGQPEKLAQKVWGTLASRRGGTLYFPFFWRWVMLILRLIPAGLFNRMKSL